MPLLDEVPQPIRSAVADLMDAVLASDYAGAAVTIDVHGPTDVEVRLTVRPKPAADVITITVAGPDEPLGDTPSGR
jgi:hypothetical protein